MDNMIRDFALQLLRRLQSRPKQDKSEDVAMNGTHEEDEDGQLPPEDIIQTPYLPEELELPAKNAQILQHLELLFALSTKVPEFIDEWVDIRVCCSLFSSRTEFSQLTGAWRRRCKRRFSS